MESQIWRMKTEKIGDIESFRSEFDMESFLMNNPAIIGCWDSEANYAIPTLIRQQIHTTKSKGESGRIDLAGISKSNGTYELRIFELKANRVDFSAVDQLKNYLDGWNKEESAKQFLKQWILNLQLIGIDNSNIDQLIKKPRGVLIGSEFEIDAIIKSKELNFHAIRLSRFRARIGQDYYVIVEDQVGDVIQNAKRTQYGWSFFVDNNLIGESDRLILSLQEEDKKIIAKPDMSDNNSRTKKIIFDKKSTEMILKKQQKIRKTHSKYPYPQRWVENVIESIKKGDSVPISNATGIIFFAFGHPTSFWVPSSYWVHEKTNQTIDRLSRLER
jgi:hypothetical protein